MATMKLMVIGLLLCAVMYPPIEACGWNTTALDGTVQSPNFPANYPNSQSCVYVITAPVGYYVSLTFTDFDIEPHDACSYDFVEIRDGDEVSPVIGRYCGTSLPGLVRSFGHQLWIRFVSGLRDTRQGFKATFVSFCGLHTTALKGVIQSPYFPANYHNNQSCVYVIKAPVGNQITLTFTDFDVEADDSCLTDFVEVRDGDEQSPVIGQYCGTSLPDPVISFGQQLWMRFVSDSSDTRRGFRATFSSACGWNTKGLKGTVHSPRFPANYPNNQRCVYVITAPVGHHVTLTFSDIDIEGYDSCSYDYVEIRDGDEDSPVIGRYCGTSLPDPVRSLGHQMWIRFVSDSVVTKRGFKATFDSACGWHTTALNGTVKSPNFPINYPNSQSCVYVITTPVGYHITLTFTDFDIERHDACRTDFVEIRDGDEQSPVIGRYCGTSRPDPVRSSGHQLWIRFVSDSSITRQGFRAAFVSAAPTTPTPTAAPTTPTAAPTTTTIVPTKTTPAAPPTTTTAAPTTPTAAPTTTPAAPTTPTAAPTTTTIVPTTTTPAAAPTTTTAGPTTTTVAPTTRRATAAPTTATVVSTTTPPTAAPTTSTPEVASTTTAAPTTATPAVASTTTTTAAPTTPTAAPTTTDARTTPITSSTPTPRTAPTTLRAISAPTTRKTTSTPPSSSFSSFPVVVNTSDSQPLDTNGNFEMTLTCEAAIAANVTSYTWSAPCAGQTGGTCVFKPRPPEDDGMEVTCIVTSSDGHVGSGELRILLNYPPPNPPTINGLSKDTVYQQGQNLTLTCSVNGGKPMVTWVHFSCGPHMDNSPDTFDTTEVHSVLSIKALSMEDDGKTCTCTARWKNMDWYKLNDTAVLRVNGTTPEETSLNIIAIAMGSTGTGVIVIVIVVIIIVWKRILAPTYTRPQRRRRNQPEENVYSVVGSTRGQSAGGQDWPNMADWSCGGDQCYFTDKADDTDESDGHYESVDDLAQASGYLTPIARPELMELTPVPHSWKKEPHVYNNEVHTVFDSSHNETM